MTDLTYCQALSEKYIRYVGNSQFQSCDRRPDVEGRVALAKCEGNAAWAIPALERKPTNGKVSLPETQLIIPIRATSSRLLRRIK